MGKKLPFGEMLNYRLKHSRGFHPLRFGSPMR